MTHFRRTEDPLKCFPKEPPFEEQGAATGAATEAATEAGDGREGGAADFAHPVPASARQSFHQAAISTHRPRLGDNIF